MKKICMFVYNNFTHDARVLKEAKTLINAGYEVSIFAVLDDKTKSYEEMDGIKVTRVVRDPFHLKFLKCIREFTVVGSFRAIISRCKRRVADPFSRIRRGSNKKNSKPDIERNNEQNKEIEQHGFIMMLKNNYRNELYNAKKKGIRNYTRELWINDWKKLLRGWNAVLLIPFMIFLFFRYTILFFVNRVIKKIYCLIILRIFRLFNKFYKQWILRPFKIVYTRYIKKAYHLGVYRPIKIIYARYIKKAINLYIIRSYKIIRYRYLKKMYFWIFTKPARYIKSVVYNILKRFLLMFHRPFCFFDYYYRCFQLIKENSFDIYHAHDLNTLPVAFWLTRRHKARLVYDSHEFYVERNTHSSSKLWKALLQKLESFFIRRTDAVITVNESLALEFSKRYSIDVPNVIMNAPSRINVPDSKEGKSLRTILSINSEYKILLYCGSITFNRGLEKLIESLKYLPNYYLVFMGYGNEEYKKSLYEKAVQHTVESRFSFFGPVPSNEVTTYAASADLGVAPIENVCLSYYYCSPNKVFEYINARLPVIASDFPEMKRVVRQYQIGTTFNPEDPLDIARAVQYVLENEDKRKRMSENTLQAAKDFNWENEAIKLIEIYETVSG